MDMIPAGSLQDSVTFQRKTETLSPSGAVTETWADLYTVRADVEAPTVDEIEIGLGDSAREFVVITVRWHPSPVKVGDRVLIDGKAFDLTRIVEVGQRKVGCKISAVAAS